MPNWSSAEELAKDSEVFIRLLFSLFGLYCWELISTIGFEWSLIRGTRKFKWPLVFFFLARYCIVWALIGLLISFSVKSEVNCNALYTFNSFCGNMSILAASTSLMLRTIALWERSLKVVIPLGILCLAHWGLLWFGMFIVHAEWVPEEASCSVDKTNHTFLSINLFYTMGFDLIVFCLTFAALIRTEARSGLWKMLFNDGLVYFLVTASANCLPAILNIRDLNITMNVIATVPAATVASIAACRAVIRLQGYASKDAYVHSESLITNEFRLSRFGPAIKTPRYNTRPEIHVTTDQIVMQDLSPASETAVNTPYDRAPFDGANGLHHMKKAEAEASLESQSPTSHGIHVQFVSAKEADDFAAHAV
ncbi:hypothetical protein NEOLEDRAFT_1131428 [Neolentinus lepideus HHB14362 ss-1]|uniref:Integral membrane protein n=1 Tax=Neolentinus lepideus HHB14362 ss-1 TaxID=1314782 RepID=A0A165TNK7_9AGAM|nr:hypothetical protein NEOLEDRAFT_1131428 [Neolentinus lepideus HHB14362 ss-1]